MGNPRRKPIQKLETKNKVSKVMKSKKISKEVWYLPREIITLSLGSLSIFVFFILFLSNRPELIGLWGVSIGRLLTQIFGLSAFFMVPILSGLAFLSWIKVFSFKILFSGLTFYLELTFLMELLFGSGGSLGKWGIGLLSPYLGMYGTGLFLTTVAIINFIILTGIRLFKICLYIKVLFLLFFLLVKKINKIFIQIYKSFLSFLDWILYVDDDGYGEDDDDELDYSNSKSEIIIKEDKVNKLLTNNSLEFDNIGFSEKTSIQDIEDMFKQSDIDYPCENNPVELGVASSSLPKSLEQADEIDEILHCQEGDKEAPLDEPYPSLENLETNDIKILDDFNKSEIDCPDRVDNKEIELPPMSLFLDSEYPSLNERTEEVGGIGLLLEETLANFGVKARVVHQEVGPSVTRYELQPAKGVRVSKITSLADDIALALAALSVRLEAPIPGKSAIGIEIPNKKPRNVYLGNILSSSVFNNSSSKLTIAFGEDITGNPVIGDLAKMPHLLIAGATGAGKSVCLNSIVASILFKAKPDEVHFAMIDPKRVELSVYKTIPHLVSINKEHRVVVSPEEASELLQSVTREMDDRYRLLAENRVRNISEFNVLDPGTIKIPADIKEGEGHLVGIENKFPMPYIVVIIDELADLMMVAPSEVEKSICRLAQLARAVGIHLVVATQRPSVNVITGIIKANIPSRISFAVSSQVDSRTILDMVGAEKLIGKGDMLYLPSGSLKPQRVQGAYVSLESIEKLVKFWENQSPPENITDFKVEVQKKDEDTSLEDFEDELLSEAIDIVLASKSASVSQLQRALKVGHARAGRLIDAMEKLKVVGPWEGSKTRKILVMENPYKNQINYNEI